MKDVWIAGAAFVFGWLMSKTWQDPGCQIGLTIFLVLTTLYQEIVIPSDSSPVGSPAWAHPRRVRE